MAIRPRLGRIHRCERSLGARPGALKSSPGLEIGKAAYSDPGDRRVRALTAAGSADETRAALFVAKAGGEK